MPPSPSHAACGMVSPYSIRVRDAGEIFGIAPSTVYAWISEGRLARSKHYLKVGNRVLIIYEEFVQFLKEEDRGWASE